MHINEIRNKLSDNGLRVTPQRVAVMEAIIRMNNHPTAEQIIHFLQKHHPNIAVGTVYKILEVLEKSHLIARVKTDSDIMRYEASSGPHHHLYCAESDKIEDYFDENLTRLLDEYFARHHIPGFKIEDIKLQLIGKFDQP